MTTPSNEARPGQPEERTLLLLWAALLVSVALYGAIGLLVLGDRGGGEGPPQVLVLALAGVAVMSSGLAFVLPGMLPALPPLPRSVLRWAFAESVGVLGLVLRTLGAGTGIFLGFVGWSALLLLLLRPLGGVEEKRVR